MRVARSTTFTPRSARATATRCTMPGRSAPYTDSANGAPGGESGTSSSMARTATTRSNRSAAPASACSRAPASMASGAATTSIIEKWPRRIDIDVSSRLQPCSTRTPVTAATMPGRSAPSALTARWWATRATVPSGPPQLVEALVVDAEMVGDLVHDGDAHLTAHVGLVAAVRADRTAEDGDAVGHHQPAVGLPLGERDALVAAEQTAGWRDVVDEQGHVVHEL